MNLSIDFLLFLGVVRDGDRWLRRYEVHMPEAAFAPLIVHSGLGMRVAKPPETELCDRGTEMVMLHRRMEWAGTAGDQGLSAHRKVWEHARDPSKPAATLTDHTMLTNWQRVNDALGAFSVETAERVFRLLGLPEDAERLGCQTVVQLPESDRPSALVLPGQPALRRLARKLGVRLPRARVEPSWRMEWFPLEVQVPPAVVQMRELIARDNNKETSECLTKSL